MSLEESAGKVEHQLGLIRGVRHASWERPGPDDLRFLVVLDETDYEDVRDYDDVRDMVIHLVDEFARDYVQEVGVDVCVMDVATADQEMASRA